MTDTTHRRGTRTLPNPVRRALHEHTLAVYREAIFAAAESVVLQVGYTPAKMVDIANAASVSVGTLYNCFASKEALFTALAEHHQAQFDSHVGQPFDTDDPLLQLRAFIMRSCEFIENNVALLTLRLGTMVPAGTVCSDAASCLVSQSSQIQFASSLESMFRQAVERGQFRSDTSATTLVWTLGALLRAMLVDWHRRPNQVSLKLRGNEVVSLFLRGVCPREGSPVTGRVSDQCMAGQSAADQHAQCSLIPPSRSLHAPRE